MNCDVSRLLNKHLQTNLAGKTIQNYQGTLYQVTGFDFSQRGVKALAAVIYFAVSADL